MSLATRAARRTRTGGADAGIAAILVAAALIGWWWSARMATDVERTDGMGSMSMGDSMSMASYLVGWVAMMTAMMFPAISPVVRLYSRAAARGTVAPLPVFVAGYLAVWSAVGLPAYFAWRALDDPLSAGDPWVGRAAGAVLIAAGVYQLTPLKRACLRHCRSPMSLFMRSGASAARASGALWMGATHGTVCVGCCWALMAVLVAVGTMHIGWMAILAIVIFVEKVLPRGEAIARLVAAALAVIGVVLAVDPSTIHTLT